MIPGDEAYIPTVPYDKNAEVLYRFSTGFSEAREKYALERGHERGHAGIIVISLAKTTMSDASLESQLTIDFDIM